MPELNLLVAALLKPLAAILAAAALVTLWRSRGGLAAGPLSAALALFLAGELFCGVDVYVLQRTTRFDDAAH
ncbi:MAG: hypothetical protein FIB01_04395 [Gemmatimonadetes bacterium]|nr:hypothetical protein [Gemmatimonadota bacterium]